MNDDLVKHAAPVYRIAPGGKQIAEQHIAEHQLHKFGTPFLPGESGRFGETRVDQGRLLTPNGVQPTPWRGLNNRALTESRISWIYWACAAGVGLGAWGLFFIWLGLI